jgi:ABC-type multidrug transport system ATPase subunit
VFATNACPLALRARNIHKSFGSGARRAPILQGISLGVPRGQTAFLVGPSGGGKTTLLSILGCVVTADCGRVEVPGAAGWILRHTACTRGHVPQAKTKILRNGCPLKPSSLAKQGVRTNKRGYLP